MRVTTNRPRLALALGGVALCVGLASCGGTDNGTPPPVTTPVADTNMPPASASASVLGFIAFVKTLVVTTPETTSPLDVSAFVAPTDDTAAFDPTI